MIDASLALILGAGWRRTEGMMGGLGCAGVGGGLSSRRGAQNRFCSVANVT